MCLVFKMLSKAFSLLAEITSCDLLWVQIRFFDLRLIFLLTAQRVDIRKQLAQEHHGISLLGNLCSMSAKSVSPYHNDHTDVG